MAYHLGVLEKEALLRAERGPGYVEYYPTSFLQADLTVFGMIRHDRSREVITLLLNSVELSQGEIASKMHSAPSTMSWYLGRMMKANVVTVSYLGRETFYRLVDPDKVRRLLSVYRSTWQDATVDNWASLWENNRLQVRRKK